MNEKEWQSAGQIASRDGRSSLLDMHDAVCYTCVNNAVRYRLSNSTAPKEAYYGNHNNQERPDAARERKR